MGRLYHSLFRKWYSCFTAHTGWGIEVNRQVTSALDGQQPAERIRLTQKKACRRKAVFHCQQFMRTRKAKKHDEQVDREVEKAISRFSQHLMSNSKWVRLIDKLVENVDKVKKIEFKKVQADQVGELYLSDDTTFGFDYWQNGFEGHNSLGGWLAFKEIEYLVFPKIVDEDTNVVQDLEQIAELIDSVGQFALDINDEKLKLVCYRK